MTQQVKLVGYSVKVTQEQKDFMNTILATEMEVRDCKKGQALASVVMEYTRAKSPEDEGPETRIYPDDEDLETFKNRINCNYLKFDPDFSFYCYENVNKKKKPDELGGDRDKVLNLCNSCLQRKFEIAQAARDKELRKEAIKKLDRFMTRYSQLAQDGFNVEAHICTANEIEGSLVFSRDGVFLACPLMLDENELPHLVPIAEHCKKKIDAGSGTRGCTYLTVLSRIVKLDKEFMEAQGVEFPNVEQATTQGPPPGAEVRPALIEEEPAEELDLEMSEEEKEQ